MNNEKSTTSTIISKMVCEHGRLARSCDVCILTADVAERDAEIARLRANLATIRSDFGKMIADIIRVERAEEREECAKVAEDTDVCAGDLVHSGEYGGFSHRVTCPKIADAIRNQQKSDHRIPITP